MRAKWPGAAYRRTTKDTMPTPPSASDRAVFDAFLARRRLDPDKYVLLFQRISQPAPWEGVDMFVTVTCASLRISRTYASGPRHGHWLAEFAQDVEGGVFPAHGNGPAPREAQAEGARL